MNYYEFLFTTKTTEDYQQDLLINALAEYGFDTFEEVDLGFKAYIPTENFDQKTFDEAMGPYRDMLTFSYQVTLIPQKNWNEVWESNFEPIEIKDKVYVRATFHPAKPEFEYEIVIDPKMAFGTGHHQTTSMMMEWMLETDFAQKNVLDMGCGTGILAILASKMGAKHIAAIDYDAVCYDSTIENSELNHIKNIIPLCGSKEAIPDDKYDIILANINRNILLEQLDRYVETLKPGGELYLSGFYESPDLEIITAAASEKKLQYIGHKKTNDWVAVKFIS
jgi:ribosomal protein L11 methyltransferase